MGMQLVATPFGKHMKREDQISPKEAYEMLQRGDAVEIIDVRQPEEHRKAHVEPSRLVPLGELSRKAGELDRSHTLLTLCRSGRRSDMAAQQLAAQGFKVRNIEGGIIAWIGARLPVTKGE